MSSRPDNFSFLSSRVAQIARIGSFSAAIAAVLTLLLTTSASGLSADVERADGDFVSGVSIRHEIDFGQQVRVELEADVNFEVDEVRAVYAPVGVRRVSSYSYPDFTVSQDGRLLSADFTIRTGGTAYLPPGTEIEVSFELTGSDGSVTATDSERILYLDPAKNWELLAAPEIPLDFHYYGFSESVAQGLVDRVAADWSDIAGAIGVELDPVERFRAVIYPNVREMTAVFPPTSEASRDGIFFGGFAMQRFGIFVLGSPWPDSVIHELTHLLIDTKVNSPLSPGVPSWLHEGLAQYFEAGSSSGYTSQLGRAASEDALLTLRNRNNVPALQNEIGLFYTQVGSFVGELIEDFGPEPMSETLSLINEGDTAAEAIESAYGVPLWQLENDWRTRLGASELPPPPQPTATPSTDDSPISGTAEPTSVSDSDATVSSATEETTVADAGVIAGAGGTAEPDGDGFNWNGPLIGAIAAAVVFMIWSFRVNRRRYRALRR